MKTPLSIHVLYHKNCKEGEKVYSSLYKSLCRDPESPCMDGMGIPVYFSTGDDNSITPLVEAGSEKVLLLLLMDAYLLCSDKWKATIKKLLEQNEDGKMKIVGVKLSSHFNNFITELDKVQMIGLKSESIVDNYEEFQTQLFDLIIRFIRGKDTEKLSVFISHTKRDKDKIGEKMAQQVRQFLFTDTKLKSFYDVKDILDGYKFDEQIKENVKNSLLLILFTDAYSSREWCRIEALTAKGNKVPIVVVSLLQESVGRLFPYIGNVPSIVYHEDWRPVINLLLKTAINFIYQTQLLESISDKNATYLPYPPEAYSLTLVEDEKQKVYYPEPPLGNEELEVLQSIGNKMKYPKIFMTPMEHLTNGTKLEGNIAISVAVSNDLSSLGVGLEMLKDLTIELSRHILKAGGKMIYGGNLTKDGFTKKFKDLSRQYGKYEKAKEDVVYFTNYLTWPIYNNISIEDEAEYRASRVKLVYAEPSRFVSPEQRNKFILSDNNDNRFLCATSLSLRRQLAEKEANARILVGGKTFGYSGCMPGLVEEFLVALNNHHPIYLIGGFGGIAKRIAQIIEKKEGNTSEQLLKLVLSDPKYESFYNYYISKGQNIDYTFLDKVSIDDLNNGLSIEQNIRLFYSVNIMEIVSLVLSGLNNKLGHS